VVPSENIVNSADAAMSEEDGSLVDPHNHARGLPNRAFWDLVAMIYPRDAEWDDSAIVDLMTRGW
jgi:hypothetical protein